MRPRLRSRGVNLTAALGGVKEEASMRPRLRSRGVSQSGRDYAQQLDPLQ